MRGLIVAAPASGAGKTTFTLGLIAALRAAGTPVQPFKSGPDYIDPTYLSAAAGGTPCANLDPFAMRPETLASLIGGEGLAIVEGVMGLHDGPGSTAALARQTGWPIVLVIDAAKSAQTAAAVAEGLALRDPDLQIAALVFNAVASPRHQAMITDGLRTDLPAIFLPPNQSLTRPSRHLGLHLASETADLAAFLAAAAKWAAPACGFADLAVESRLGPAGQSSHVRLSACAHLRPEFGLTFAYPHTQIPDGTIFLPGGYPELYLSTIKRDPTFLASLREAAADGVPIYGECGGFMVLGQAIIDQAGTRHEMAGLLPHTTSFTAPNRHLGYRQIETLADFALGAMGQRWRGHEFHYTHVAGDLAFPAEPLFHAWDAYGADLGPQGWRAGNVSGSYLHLIDKSA